MEGPSHGMDAMMQSWCSGSSFCWSFQASHGQDPTWACPCHHNQICLDLGTENHVLSLHTLPWTHCPQGSSVSRTRANNTCFGLQRWGFWARGYKSEVGGGWTGESGICVLRGPLLNINILAIVHFVAQSFAASFSNPDGLNWHFHYVCLH